MVCILNIPTIQRNNDFNAFVSFWQELMDQVKCLKLEKDIKNGTIRSHGGGKALLFVACFM